MGKYGVGFPFGGDGEVVTTHKYSNEKEIFDGPATVCCSYSLRSLTLNDGIQSNQLFIKWISLLLF